jgi:hypothetical protein
MKSKTRKLVLNRETVRALEDPDLRVVVGGGTDEPVLAGPAGQLEPKVTIHQSRCYCTGDTCYVTCWPSCVGC